MLATMNVFEVNDSDKVMHDVGNENDVEIESVEATGFHHDHGNDNSMRDAQQDGHANVSPLCAECPAETGSSVEGNDAKAALHA